MFDSLRRVIMPLTLSEARSVVQDLYSKESRARRWFYTPINMLIEVCGDIAVTKVTEEHIATWERLVHSDKSPEKGGGQRSNHTIDSYKRCMRAFWNHLVKMGYVKHSPASKLNFRIVLSNEPKHLHDGDIEALLNAAADNARDFAMIHALRASGIRIGGLLSMQASQLNITRYRTPEDNMTEDEWQLVQLARQSNLEHMIDQSYLWFYQGDCTVIEKGKRGSKKIHTAFFDHDCCIALLNYLKTRPAKSSDALWITSTGEALTESGVYLAFKRVAARAGVDASPHALRHTFATRLLSQDVDPKTVSMFLGHADFRTTLKVYMNPRKEDLARKYRQTRNSGYNNHR